MEAKLTIYLDNNMVRCALYNYIKDILLRDNYEIVDIKSSTEVSYGEAELKMIRIDLKKVEITDNG